MSKTRITIQENETTADIKRRLNIPRGATHFRFNLGRGKKPIIDKIKNLDLLEGCEGTIEFGKAIATGVGRNYRITGFNSMEAAVDPQPEQTPTTSKPAAPVATPAKEAKRGRHKNILGFSACAVLKALGAAGVKREEAERILAKHDITMPKASVGVQLGFGRNEKSWERHGKPAPLSEAQIAELRAS